MDTVFGGGGVVVGGGGVVGAGRCFWAGRARAGRSGLTGAKHDSGAWAVVMLHSLLVQIRAQPCDQFVDFTTAIEMAGVDATDQQIDLIGLVIAAIVA